MAENSEQDELVPGLNTTISRFLSSQEREDDEVENITARKSPLLLKKHKYEMELLQLEKEVHELEEKLARHEKLMSSRVTQQHIDRALEEVEGQSLAAGSPTEQLMKEIDGLQSEIGILGSLTGVNLAQVRCVLVKQEKHAEEKVYTIWGNAHSFDFRVQFTVVETLLGDGKWSMKIVNLKIAVEENIVNEMGDLLEVLEKTCDLPRFFQSFETFTKWTVARQRAFSHFKDKYSHAVTLPHGYQGDYMLIMSTYKSALVCTVTWSIRTEEGKITPDISITVKAPNNVISNDTSGVIKGAPHKFKEMLTSLGIEKAIEVFINLLN